MGHRPTLRCVYYNAGTHNACNLALTLTHVETDILLRKIRVYGSTP
jgi:hypothetical protein